MKSCGVIIVIIQRNLFRCTFTRLGTIRLARSSNYRAYGWNPTVWPFKETSSTVVLTFDSVDETLWCDHSNETSSTVLSHSTPCFARSFNFCVGSQWTTETIQTKPLFCFTYACQADFEFISLVSLQNNNVTQTSSSCCSSRFTVSWEVVNLAVLSCKDDLSDVTCFSKLTMSS